VQKLKFADTDITKFTNVVMRMCQQLELDRPSLSLPHVCVWAASCVACVTPLYCGSMELEGPMPFLSLCPPLCVCQTECVWRRAQHVLSQPMGYTCSSLHASSMLYLGRCRVKSAQDAGVRQNAHDRLQFSCYEIAHALYMWKRQLLNHNSFYTHSQHLQLSQPNRPQADAPARPPNPDADMTVEMSTQRMILSNPRCAGRQTTQTVRAWTRNRIGHRGGNVHTELLQAVRSLSEAGVVRVYVAAEEDAEPVEASARPRGREVLTFEKNTWISIQASALASERVQALRLTADHFP